MRKEVMQLAWQFRRDNDYDMSEALEVAWMNANLVRMMRNSVVEFEFYKSDGSRRVAHGTLRRDMCPMLKGANRERNRAVQVYFDVDKGEWRCFNKTKLLKS